MHIFTDFDRLTERGALLGETADRLQDAGNLVLNHPRRTLMRLDLLRTLHEAGINDFNAYPLAEWRQAKRFPVFFRFARAHHKPLTDLIEDSATVKAVAERLLAEHGTGSDIIVVEFGNARDPDGRFRKYSAFRVGDVHYASSLQANSHWWVKYSEDESEADKAAQTAFADTNPHRDQLAPAWEAAGIDYGRMDYCVVDGRVQVFEINTNPTVAFIPGEKTRGHQHYAVRHERALEALIEAAPDGSAISNPMRKPGLPEWTARTINAVVLREGRKNWAKNWARE